MYGGLLPNRFALRTLSAPPGLMILGCFAIRAPFYLTARMKPIARMILMIVDVVANSSKSRLLMFLLLSKADQGKYRVKRLGVGLVFFAPSSGLLPGATCCLFPPCTLLSDAMHHAQAVEQACIKRIAEGSTPPQRAFMASYNSPISEPAIKAGI